VNVPHDRSFSDLSTAMNLEKVAGLLQKALANDHSHITVLGGRICDIKYDTDKQYIILYRFKLQHTVTDRTSKQLFTARVLKNGDPMPGEPPFEEQLKVRDIEHVWITSPHIRLPGHNITLYPFPHDIKMPWLREALDSQVMKDRFNRMWMYQQNVKVRKVKIRLLGYTPQMRASFLYEVLIEDKETGARKWEEIIGKTNIFKSPDNLYIGIWALWQAWNGEIGLPRPLGFMMHPRLTLQEKVRGVRLGSIVDSPSLGVIMKETARSIARFHSLSIPLRTKRKLRDEIRSIERWSNVLIKIRPDLKGRLESFRLKVLSEIERRMSIKGPVHADFHHTNVLVDGTDVRLIDLDEMALGDPCLDVGRFLASLRIPSLRTFGTINNLQNERELFLEEYLKTRPENTGTIHLFESASLLIAAASAFRIQRPDWKNEVSLLVDEAERVFASVNKGKGVTSPKEQNKAPQISPEERVHWALDETYVQTLLTSSMKELYDADIGYCKVMKKKKIHSGYRIRYRVAGWRQDKKWKSLIEGIVSTRDSGSTFFNHLLMLQDVLQNSDARSLFPLPITYSPQISTVFTGSLEGKPFLSLLGTPEIMGATDKLAKALYMVHNSNIKLSKVYSAEDDIADIQRKISRLKKSDSHFYSIVFPLFSEIGEQIKMFKEKVSPIVYALQPQKILYDNNSVSITNFAKLRFSHPYFDIGNFLAQLAFVGIQEGRKIETEKIADQFRISYKSTSGSNGNGFYVFEAGALVRIACHQLERYGSDALPLKILDYARKRLE
jgi:thiamine kinase-like enzyme